MWEMSDSALQKLSWVKAQGKVFADIVWERDDVNGIEEMPRMSLLGRKEGGL